MRRSHDVLALLCRCALLAGVALVPPAFSARIDPARLLGAPDSERAIAQALVAGHNVTNASNYDDRAIARLLAVSRATGPDVLALGSSRIQPLPASAFPGRPFANAGLAGARLDDILAVYAVYDTTGRRPRRIVLNLDPWTLQEDADGLSWRALVDERASLLARLGVPTTPWLDRLRVRGRVFRKLAYPESFRLAVWSLRRYGSTGISFVVTDSPQNVQKTMTPNGTIVWSRTLPATAEQLVREYLAVLPADARYQKLGDVVRGDRVALLERFVRYLRSEGVEVTLFLSPYHPLVFDALVRRADQPLGFTEARYRALANRSGASVVGSYDPSRAGVRAEDFFDESHLRPAALVRLLGRLAAPVGP